ncbi:MAG: hypothetical protein MIO92_11120, partial [Methanosarcinaceae archaeon]|nr:hypothetical protein [Methanosarcinaceae archaeon]
MTIRFLTNRNIQLPPVDDDDRRFKENINTVIRDLAMSLSKDMETLTGDDGVVLSVTATNPVESTGGVNPVISMDAATASAPGYATAAQITKLDG